MTFSTTEKVTTASLPKIDANSFIVSLSDAEAQVIRNKARKAGVNINEYIRNAALGFPMS